MRAALLFSLTFSAAVWGETGWLTSRGRLLPEARIEAFAGTGSAGIGVVMPGHDEGGPGFGAELAFDHANRFIEARVTRVWQLTTTRFATATATAALTGFVVPSGPAAVGAGPHVGVNLALGGRWFTVDFSADAGAEGFSSGPSRLPVRLATGLNGRIRQLTLAVMARAGADLVTGHPFVGRGELALVVGWLDLF